MYKHKYMKLVEEQINLMKEMISLQEELDRLKKIPLIESGQIGRFIEKPKV